MRNGSNTCSTRRSDLPTSCSRLPGRDEVYQLSWRMIRPTEQDFRAASDVCEHATSGFLGNDAQLVECISIYFEGKLWRRGTGSFVSASLYKSKDEGRKEADVCQATYELMVDSLWLLKERASSFVKVQDTHLLQRQFFDSASHWARSRVTITTIYITSESYSTWVRKTICKNESDWRFDHEIRIVTNARTESTLYNVDYEELFVLGADVCITFEIRFKKLLLLTSTHCSAHYNVVRRNTACRIFLPAIFSYNIPSFRLRHRYLQNTSTVYFKALIRVIMTLVSILTIEIAVQQSVVVFNGWPTPSY